MDFYIQREYALISQNASQFGPAVFRYTPILNMLNTKYCILNPNQEDYKSISWGTAWFSNVKTVETVDEAMQALGDSSIDLRTTAVIHKDFQNIKTPKNIDAANISLTKYGLNHMSMLLQVNLMALLFLVKFILDGWNCYIDGKLVEHFK